MIQGRRATRSPLATFCHDSVADWVGGFAVCAESSVLSPFLGARSLLRLLPGAARSASLCSSTPAEDGCPAGDPGLASGYLLSALRGGLVQVFCEKEKQEVRLLLRRAREGYAERTPLN